MTRHFLISFAVLLLLSNSAEPSDNDQAAGQYRRAHQLFSSNQFREALSLYQKLLASPPKSVPKSEIQTRIGDTFVRLGQFQNALGAYRTALPDQDESRRPETQYWIGFCCFLLGRDAEAVDEFLKVPQQYPGSGMWVSTAYYWAGRASERMGKADDAAAYYRKAGGSGKSKQDKFARKKADALKGANTKE